MSDVDNVRQLIEKIAIDHNYKDVKISPLPYDGRNYLTKINLATLSADDKEDMHLFVKYAAVTELMRSQYYTDPYKGEYTAYTYLTKVFKKLEDAHGIPDEHRFTFIKYYGSDMTYLSETIALEDLTKSGYENIDKFEVIDWPFAAATLTELAKLHALSMACEIQYHDDYAKLMEVFAIKWKTDVEDPGVRDFWKNVANTALGIVNEENKERLKKFFDRKPWGCYGEPFHHYGKLIRKPTICHGDLKSINVLYKSEDDSTMKVIIADLQTLQLNAPVTDLCYFLFTSSDKKFRDKYYQKFFNHYYSELSAALRRLHLDPDQVYSREDYDFDLKEQLPLALGSAVFIVPVTTADVDNSPKVGNEMDINSYSVTNNSAICAERLNDIVDDFVRLGVI